VALTASKASCQSDPQEEGRCAGPIIRSYAKFGVEVRGYENIKLQRSAIRVAVKAVGHTISPRTGRGSLLGYNKKPPQFLSQLNLRTATATAVVVAVVVVVCRGVNRPSPLIPHNGGITSLPQGSAQATHLTQEGGLV
jgi:hypothetical protein